MMIILMISIMMISLMILGEAEVHFQIGNISCPNSNFSFLQEGERTGLILESIIDLIYLSILTEGF